MEGEKALNVLQPIYFVMFLFLECRFVNTKFIDNPETLEKFFHLRGTAG